MSVVRHSHYKWSHLGTRVCLCRHQSSTTVATCLQPHSLQMYSTREVCEVERLYYPPPLRLFSLDLYYVKMLFIRQGQTLRTRPDIYVVPLSVRWKEKTRSINFSTTKWRNELFGWSRIIVINKKTVWIFFYTYNGWFLLTFRNISIFERPRFFYSEREEHSCNNKF